MLQPPPLPDPRLEFVNANEWTPENPDRGSSKEVIGTMEISENLMYSGPPIDDADVLSVYVILNGPLKMSPGKSAAQSFHVGWLSAFMEHWLGYGKGIDKVVGQWQVQGRRVVVRVAETPHVFERVIKECEGVLQRDEGLTEVERGSATAFATIPYRRDSIPKILTHKRCQLY